MPCSGWETQESDTALCWLQVEAHHFCACPNEDVRQCVIYDSDKPNARLIGLEYIISSKLFAGLPEDEKIYWHSHKYEVQSGTLQVCETTRDTVLRRMVAVKVTAVWYIQLVDVQLYRDRALHGDSDSACITESTLLMFRLTVFVSHNTCCCLAMESCCGCPDLGCFCTLMTSKADLEIHAVSRLAAGSQGASPGRGSGDEEVDQHIRQNLPHLAGGLWRHAAPRYHPLPAFLALHLWLHSCCCSPSLRVSLLVTALCISPTVIYHVRICYAGGSPGLFVHMQLIRWDWTIF